MEAGSPNHAPTHTHTHRHILWQLAARADCEEPQKDLSTFGGWGVEIGPVGKCKVMHIRAKNPNVTYTKKGIWG